MLRLRAPRRRGAYPADTLPRGFPHQVVHGPGGDAVVEAGQINLDAPAQHYLPWFRVADPDVSAAMTVRHLLNQTSGLPQLPGVLLLADLDQRPGARERAWRSRATLALSRPPGSAWEYSNLNYNLLGLIVEAVSGTSYEAYIHLEVIPLLLLAAAAWRWPQAAGYGLAGIGLVLAVVYPVLVGSFPLATILTVEAVLFVPLLLAGALLLLAARPGPRRSTYEEPRDQ